MKTIIEMIKKTLRPFIPQMVINLFKKRYQKKLILKWENDGCPVPPPHIVKQLTIKEYQSKYLYEVLVETGT